MKYIARIPRSSIARLALITGYGRSLEQVRDIENPDLICNAGFFDWIGKPTHHIKADGIVRAQASWTCWGYAWDVGSDINLAVLPAEEKRSYIAAYELITPYNTVDKELKYSADLGDTRGRTAMGLAGDTLVLLCSADASADAMTPEELREAMLAEGCTNALMLDGGGSSQCDFGSGKIIDSSRPVDNYLCVWLKREVTPMDEIKQDFMTKNQCYTNGKTITPKGIMVHSTGTPGLMAQDLRDRWNDPAKEVSVHAMIDDTVTIQTLPWTAKAWHCASTGNSTHTAFEICEPQETRLIPVNWVAQKRNQTADKVIPWAITRIQQELVARGYDPNGIDGKFGPGCEAAVKKFQADNGLDVDGSVGKATLSALANREGSYVAYDPAETQDYFEAIWSRSVALCAYLCKEYGLDPEEDILCHQEGYRAGIANNHADVLHWFPLHGYSMDDFRTAVKLAIEGCEEQPVVDPFADAVEVLVEKGIITTPAYWTQNDTYRTDYVRTLIQRCAEKLKS